MSFRRGHGGGSDGGRFGGGRGRDGDGPSRGRGGRDGGGGAARLSNHTSDASMASARIFIGNLPTTDPRLSKEYLEEQFSPYGHIMGECLNTFPTTSRNPATHFPNSLITGISILKGFGFIQYAEEMSAEEAIRGAQNMEILGHRIGESTSPSMSKSVTIIINISPPTTTDVKHVKSGKDGSMGGGSGDFGGLRDRSPLRGSRTDLDLGSMGRGPPPRDHDIRHREAERGGPPGRGGGGDFGGGGPGRGDQRDWNRGPRELDPYMPEPLLDHERDMRPRDLYPPILPERANFGSVCNKLIITMSIFNNVSMYNNSILIFFFFSFLFRSNLAPAAPAANEVEIIVTSKSGPVRQYAERIEGRLKNQGLLVDVLFPHEEIPIRQVLMDLSARGTLFGIVVTPVNQEHGSITLSILFGQPEGKRRSWHFFFLSFKLIRKFKKYWIEGQYRSKVAAYFFFLLRNF